MTSYSCGTTFKESCFLTTALHELRMRLHDRHSGAEALGPFARDGGNDIGNEIRSHNIVADDPSGGDATNFLEFSS